VSSILFVLAAGPPAATSMSPLTGFEIFLGIPAAIVVLVVLAVYGSRWKLVREQHRTGGSASRSAQTLTAPVLGSPGTPVHMDSRPRSTVEPTGTTGGPAAGSDVAEPDGDR
jgi:threonine/homoserine/homoserine lactone efflux protein